MLVISWAAMIRNKNGLGKMLKWQLKWGELTFKEQRWLEKGATITLSSNEKLDKQLKACVAVPVPITDILQWRTVLLNFIPVKIKSI